MEWKRRYTYPKLFLGRIGSFVFLSLLGEFLLGIDKISDDESCRGLEGFIPVSGECLLVFATLLDKIIVNSFEYYGGE